jgi:hypothetical protein
MVLLGAGLRSKAGRIAAALGDACIDLTGQADQLQAFAIVGRAARCPGARV